MTTLAFDGRIMAADSMISGFHSGIRYNKLFVGRQGDSVVCIGGCGSAASFAPAVHWYLTDGAQATYPNNDMRLMVVSNVIGSIKPRVVIIETSGGRVVGPFPHAEGSGGEVAIGALLAGKNAIEAIEIAAKYDNATNGDIIAFDLISGEWVHEPSIAMTEQLDAMLEPFSRRPPARRPARRKKRNA